MKKSHGFEDRFYDIATMGERGQIVIPSKARKDLNIKAGDKFVALKAPLNNGIVFIKISGMTKMLSKLTSVLDKIGK